MKHGHDVEQRDIVLDILNALHGDFDANGDVSFSDFSVSSNHFGQDPASYTDGNIDLQNGVDFADFLVLSNNFGRVSKRTGDRSPNLISV